MVFLLYFFTKHHFYLQNMCKIGFQKLLSCYLWPNVPNMLKEPQVIETRAFPRIDYALITAKTQVTISFVQYQNFERSFLNWSAWSSTVITADEIHSYLISLQHHHTISYHNNREAWALVHKIRNQDLVQCLRVLKERHGQNRPG